MAIVFDGQARRIILDRATISAAEIWTAWVDWQIVNQQWPMALLQDGGKALGGGRYTPIYFFLLNDWRIRPMEMNHRLSISGNIAVDGEDASPIVPTLGNYNVVSQYVVPLQAQAISISGGGGGGTYVGPTAAEIAQAVWSYQP